MLMPAKLMPLFYQDFGEQNYYFIFVKSQIKVKSAEKGVQCRFVDSSSR